MIGGHVILSATAPALLYLLHPCSRRNDSLFPPRVLSQIVCQQSLGRVMAQKVRKFTDHFVRVKDIHSHSECAQTV